MIVDLAMLKEQCRVDFDDDNDLLERKIAAAQNHVERLLGYKIEEQYPPTDDSPPASTIPPALIEAVCQLATLWYQHREAAIEGDVMMAIPFGLDDVVREYRNFSFDG